MTIMRRNGIPEEDSRHSLPLRKAVLPFAIYTSLNLGGVLAGILAAGLFWNSVGRLALGHAEAEIAKAGFSLELPANSARPPDSENAAYWFQKAAAAPSLKEFTSPKFFEKKSQAKFLRDFFMHAQSRALTDSDLALARKLIKTHKEAVSLARKGASMRSVHWGTDWSVRSYYILPAPRDYAGLFALGQLLTCGAIVAASDGNASLSVELVRDAPLPCQCR